MMLATTGALYPQVPLTVLQIFMQRAFNLGLLDLRFLFTNDLNHIPLKSRVIKTQ